MFVMHFNVPAIAGVYVQCGAYPVSYVEQGVNQKERKSGYYMTVCLGIMRACDISLPMLRIYFHVNA
jgi:hypothetical protein